MRIMSIPSFRGTGDITPPDTDKLNNNPIKARPKTDTDRIVNELVGIKEALTLVAYSNMGLVKLAGPSQPVKEKNPIGFRP